MAWGLNVRFTVRCSPALIVMPAGCTCVVYWLSASAADHMNMVPGNAKATTCLTWKAELEPRLLCSLSIRSSVLKPSLLRVNPMSHKSWSLVAGKAWAAVLQVSRGCSTTPDTYAAL